MGDAYKIVFQKGAIADLKALDKSKRVLILKRIEARLGVDPLKYGVPLRHAFAGLYKLRVGEYRVVFIVEGILVDILVVGLRSRVYQKLGRRMG